MPEITDKQRAFCDLVLNGHALAVAARMVGVKRSSAQHASRWMKMKVVKEYLFQRRAEISSPKISEAKERQELLAEIARGNVEDVGLFFGEQKRFGASLAIRIKAMELLARMRGELLTEKAPQTNVVYVVESPQPRGNSLEWAKMVEAEVVAENGAR